MANDRIKPLRKIVDHPDVLIGFSDAGAHLRNMAHYSFPLRLLKLVQDGAKEGKNFMSMERAFYRLTGEIGDWFGLPCGRLMPGRKADIVIIDPDGLDAALDETHEEEMPGFEGLRRLVRRNPKAVPHVFINGIRAIRDGLPVADLGRTHHMGRVLRVKS